MPVKLSSSGGGSVTLDTPSTASNYTVTLPAANATLADTSSTQTLTNKTLTAAGSNTVEATSGPTSTQLAGNRNKIINGAMMIDQRNAGAAVTVSGDSTYCVDRFAGFRSSPVNNFTLQQSSTAPSGFINSLVATMGTGVSPGTAGYAMVAQRIEGANIADLNLGTSNASPFILSFWVRCSVSGTFGVAFRNGTATATYCATYTINATNTWEYKTISVPAITAGTWATNNTEGLAVCWDLGVGTTYSATAGQLTTGANYFGVTGTTKLAATTGATFYITGVQLEKGATATPFENRLYGTELALCQRYYQKMSSLLVAGYVGTAAGTYYSGSTSFLVEMRATPTLSLSGFVNSNSGNATASGVSNRCFRFFASNTAAGSAYSLFDMETTGAEL